MAGGINSVVLVGRLTRDVELRKTASGVSMAMFTVAVDRRYSSQNSQQGNGNQPTADFISCVAWRQRADFLGSYGKKGTLVGVQGEIQTRNYTNQQGQKVYVTEVLVDNVQLLGSRSNNQSTQPNSYSSYNQPSSMPQDPYESVPSQPAGDASSQPNNDGFNTGPSLDISSDDLPF